MKPLLPNKILMSARKSIREFIDRRLSGSYDYFLQQLPVRKGAFSSWLLRKFYSGIVINKDQTTIFSKLPEDAIVVYTTKHKSYFEYLFYHTRFQQEKLPVPELGIGYRTYLWQSLSRLFNVLLANLDYLYRNRARLNPYTSGFVERYLLSGASPLVSLVEKKGFYRRFVKSKIDPLAHLIRIQNAIDRPVFMVPLLMFFGKSPQPAVPGVIDILFGPEHEPGVLRRALTLLRKPGKTFVEISEPVNIRRFLERADIIGRSEEYQALMLRRHMLFRHNRHRQCITGPILKSNEEIKEAILTNERMRQFMAQHAKNRKEPIHEIRKRADAYLDEISAKYNFAFIKFVSGIVGWIINTMFDGAVVDKAGLNRVKNRSQKGPLVLIPCHKSHIDYLILSYVLYNNNMPCPHIAAGKNLSFWPLGPIFRAGGAFFIRRTFRGAILYSKVFSEYIYKLLEEGFNIEQFIEGGRSRTGKLLMPKLGLLSIMINAYKNGACEDMLFVPVYIGYDRVLEESAYLHEIEGGKKEPENFKQVIRARRFLKKRYGKIYINFHEPISMNELLSQQRSSLDEMSTKEVNAIIRNIGWRVINAIDNETVVTPHSLMAAAFLNCPKDRFSFDDIIAIFDTYFNLLLSQKAILADTLLIDPVRAAETAFESYTQRKIIEPVAPAKKTAPSEDSLFMIKHGKRPALEYYKNNCIAAFIPAAMTALAILEKDAFQFSAADLHMQYMFMQDFFKYEFAFDLDRSPEFFIRKSIKSFIDDAVLMPHPTLPDTYNITSSGLRKLIVFARFFKTYFESYHVVLSFLKGYERNSISPKERAKKIQSLGAKMFKQKEIELNESLSKINFDNAFTFFSNNRIKCSEAKEQIEHFDESIKKYLHLLE